MSRTLIDHSLPAHHHSSHPLSRLSRAHRLTAFAEGSTTPATTTAAPPAPATRQAAIEQQQAAKVETLQPVAPGKAERDINKVEDILTNGLTWRPYFESAYHGGGFRSASATCVTSARTTRSTCAAATRSAATSARRPSSSRRICSTAAASCRCSAAGAKRRQVGFYGIGPDTSKDAPHQLRVRAAVRLGHAHADADAPSLDARGRPRMDGVGAGARRRAVPVGRDRVHAGDAAGLGATSPTSTRRRRSASTGGLPPAMRGAAASTASRCTTTRHTNGRFGFDADRLRGDPAHSRSCAKRGSSRFAASRRPRSTRAVRRSRSSCCRRWAAGRRCAAISSWRFRDRNSLLLQAEWRIMVNRFFDTALFYDAGKVAARPSDLDLHGMPHDCGFGFRFHGPDATVLRIDVATSDEGTRVVVRRRPRVLRVLPVISSDLPYALALPRAAPGAGAPRRSCLWRASPSRRRRRASIPTIRSRANRNRRTRPARSRTRSSRCTR